MSGESAESRPPAAPAAVTALVLILAITAAWWALALWPLPAEAAWLTRARAVCFGASANGLPDAAGWIALVVQPTLMIGILITVWGGEVAAGLRRLAVRPAGRLVIAGVALLILTGITAAGLRVRDAQAGERTAVSATLPPVSYPRLDRAAPELKGLVDQGGVPATLARFKGRPLLVTFGFGHCETVCPLVVGNTLRSQRKLDDIAPVVVVITLDPWRDTPSRLPHIAESWGMASDAYLLSGDVETVNAVLDDWSVARRRDATNGDIEHTALVYLLDEEGEMTYAASGETDVIVELARRL